MLLFLLFDRMALCGLVDTRYVLTRTRKTAHRFQRASPPPTADVLYTCIKDVGARLILWAGGWEIKEWGSPMRNHMRCYSQYIYGSEGHRNI